MKHARDPRVAMISEIGEAIRNKFWHGSRFA